MIDHFLSKRALITGATGYIGSNLVKCMVKQGWDIHIIIRSSSDLKILDDVLSKITVHRYDGTGLGIADIITNAKPEIIFHLASLFLVEHKIDDIDTLVSSNLIFSTQLLEAMAMNGVKYIINTGTSWQHYNNNNYNPVNLYAATKQAFEAILTYYIEAHGIKATTLALFDTYGPNDLRSKLIPLLWKTANSQEPLSMSPGEQLIDLVYIDDVVRAYIMAANILKDQSLGHICYGVSSGGPMSLIDLVAVFQKVTNTRLPISFGGRPYRSREVMVPWRDFKSIPEWYPWVSFEEGIMLTRSNSC